MANHRSLAGRRGRVRTVVLDDDPTGTQSATGVRVLLASDADAIEAALRDAESVYVQTNSRAIDEPAAVELVGRIRRDAFEAGRRLGADIEFVLRGDSTLRGHVFAEVEVFAGRDSRVVFVPAFPDGGRTTVHGTHFVRVDGTQVPAHESEFGSDPVFPLTTSVLADYVTQKSGRPAFPIDIEAVRAGADELADAIADAPPGSVVVPDAVTSDDIGAIAQAIETARAKGVPLVVRCAAPLAAALARVASDGLLAEPLVEEPGNTLLVCGSHTTAATEQLAEVAAKWGDPIVVDTRQSLADPSAVAAAVTKAAREQLLARGLAVVVTERVRSPEHKTLDHGARVMQALTGTARGLLPQVGVVIAKGGVTSADVARLGLDARSATVLGQVLPGVPVWELECADGGRVLYVIVPGNVGETDTLVRALSAVGHRR